MKILVMKFGGTSVDSPEHREIAARKVIRAKEDGFAPVVVVSAIGRRGAPYATDTLIEFLRSIDPSVPPNPREMDLMMACGEIISTVVMAHTLKTMGYDAVALTGGQAGIITDSEYGNARVLQIHPQAIRHYLEAGKIVVVAGFQGVAEDKLGFHPDITTLGRGGSDTTASALGAALNAVAVEIYTDVNGVKTADPDIIPDAKTLPVISYEEVAEIAHQGAKVLHPRAAEIAMLHNIPLWVKCTFTDETGTLVTSAEGAEGVDLPEVTGVTHITGKIVYLIFHIGEVPEKPEIELQIYRMLAQADVNLYLNSYSHDTLSFAVPRDRWSLVQNLLDGLVMPVGSPPQRLVIFRVGEKPTREYQLQKQMLSALNSTIPVQEIAVDVLENCTMVSLIAAKLSRRPGVMALFLRTLYEAGIQVLQTADSEMSLSCLVNESDVEKAVRVLHERFVTNRAYAR
ncbi:Aspartokinase [bacterium HR16]|nr:Aspartokinase [bacterium HR16]